MLTSKTVEHEGHAKVVFECDSVPHFGQRKVLINPMFPFPLSQYTNQNPNFSIKFTQIYKDFSRKDAKGAKLK